MPDIGRVGGAFPQHRRGHQDGHERVVQVVGNAAGQSADAFHSLGAEKLFLGVFLGGDIGSDAEAGLRLPGIVTDKRRADLHDEDLVLLVAGMHFAAPFIGFLQCLARRLDFHRGPATEDFPKRPAEDLGREPSTNALGALVPKGDEPGEIRDNDGVARLVDEIGLLPDPLLGDAVAS